MQAAKQSLRKQVKKTLASLSDQERERQSAVITRKLLGLPQYQRSRKVAVYLNLPEEVRTSDIVRDLLGSCKACFVPRFDPNSAHMDMVRVHSMDDVNSLPQTKYSVHQPADGDQREDALMTGGLDLVIVPGLGFSSAGDRLGRGKSYYDTFLWRCARSQTEPPYTVGLAFSQQLLDEVPTEPHDRKLDLVLHPGWGNQ